MTPSPRPARKSKTWDIEMPTCDTNVSVSHILILLVGGRRVDIAGKDEIHDECGWDSLVVLAARHERRATANVPILNRPRH